MTTGFSWPDKKVDIGFESSGNKEVDQDDAAEGRAAAGRTPAAATAAAAGVASVLIH